MAGDGAILDCRMRSGSDGKLPIAYLVFFDSTTKRQHASSREQVFPFIFLCCGKASSVVLKIALGQIQFYL